MRFWRTSLEQISAIARVSRWRQRLPRPRLTRPRGWAAVAGVAAVITLTLTGAAIAGVTAAGPAGRSPGRPAQAAAKPARSASRHERLAQAAGKPGRSGSRRPAGPARAPAHRRAAAAHRRAAAAARQMPLRSSCRSVAHIGDSTSMGLISPEVLPDPAQRLAARYADVGVRHLLVDASGGRSIVEVLPGQVNGYNVARGWASHGYRGCWVFALGTNDTANVSVGSDVGRLHRIERMMSPAHGAPVLWVNTRTLLSAGPWAESNMRIWNADLRRACASYPNMRIFDWASVANPGWYLSDGIHYTSAGYAVRARAIADALARAFSRGGASRGCVVR
jgi:hypothetical protein